MTQDRFILVGCINPLDTCPSFVAPVFISESDLQQVQDVECLDKLFWLQNIANETVVGFLRSDSNEYTFQHHLFGGCRNKLRRRLEEFVQYRDASPFFDVYVSVGEPCIRAFMMSSQQFIVGNRKRITPMLYENLKVLEDHPYAHLDALEYLGERSQFNSVLKEIERRIARFNPVSAQQWRRYSELEIGFGQKLRLLFRKLKCVIVQVGRRFLEVLGLVEKPKKETANSRRKRR